MALGAGRDDRVVVGDLGVVDHAPERKHLEAEDVLARPARTRLLADQLGDRLDLGDHVAGQVPRVRTRIRQRLVLLVEPLRGRQRPPRREPVAAVRVALERGQVVRSCGRSLRSDFSSLVISPVWPWQASTIAAASPQSYPRVRAGVVPALVGARRVLHRIEDRVDEPVRLGLEIADLLLAPGQNRERRRLHPAQRHRAVKRGAKPDRRRAGGVHADDPVGLRARAGGLLERARARRPAAGRRTRP